MVLLDGSASPPPAAPGTASKMSVHLMDLPTEARDLMFDFLVQHKVAFKEDPATGLMSAHVKVCHPQQDLSESEMEDDAQDAQPGAKKGLRRLGQRLGRDGQLVPRKPTPESAVAPGLLQAEITRSFPEFVSLIGQPVKKIKALTLPDLRSLIEDVYAERYAMEHQMLKLEVFFENSEEGYFRQKHTRAYKRMVEATDSFPRILVARTTHRTGVPAVVTTVLWSIAAATVKFRTDHFDVDLFARFLSLQHDETDLLFFLNVNDHMRRGIASADSKGTWTRISDGSSHKPAEWQPGPLNVIHTLKDGEQRRSEPLSPRSKNEDKRRVGALIAVETVVHVMPKPVQAGVLEALDAAIRAEEERGQKDGLKVSAFLQLVMEQYTKARKEGKIKPTTRASRPDGQQAAGASPEQSQGLPGQAQEEEEEEAAPQSIATLDGQEAEGGSADDDKMLGSPQAPADDAGEAPDAAEGVEAAEADAGVSQEAAQEAADAAEAVDDAEADASVTQEATEKDGEGQDTSLEGAF